MGNTWSCLACSSSETGDVMDVSPLLEMVQDVSQVDYFISLIEDRLNATANAMNKAEQASTSTVSVQETVTSSRFPPNFIKFGHDLFDKVLNSVQGDGRGKRGFRSKVDRATLKVIGDVAKELAKSHLVAAGLSVVAYVLDQIDKVSSNKEKCVELLGYMCTLAKRVKQLNELLPGEKEKLNEAIKIIVKGSIMCATQMDSHYISRFFSASVEAADLQTIESQIRQKHSDLNLGALISILERVPVLLSPSLGEDPRPVGTEKQQDNVTRLLNIDINDKSRRAVGRDEVRKAFKEATSPIFMFIDNALKGDDLKKVLPMELSSLPPRTRILLTTRNLAETDMFLDSDHIQRYAHEVDILSPKEAKEILCKNALTSANAKFDESVDIDGLVEICGGIPLVLEMVGSKLKKYVNYVTACKEKIESLKKALIEGQNEKSDRVVDFVYNSLDEDCKHAFLDIARFFHNRPLRKASYAVGEVELQTLEDAALVKVVPQDEESEEYMDLDDFVEYMDRKEGILKVHDIVRARGRRLSQSDRITDYESLEEVLTDTQKLQKIKGISLLTSMEMEAKHLDMMSSSLRVREAPHIAINGRCTRSFDNLRYVDLRYASCNPPMDLSKLKRVSFLDIHTVENVRELPASLRHLRCQDLLLPDFGENLSSLEHLDISSSKTLASLPYSFGELKSLRFLDMSSCTKLVTLPDSFASLSALERLDLSGCHQLSTLPPTFGQLSSLSFLDLRDTNLTMIPDSFGDLFCLKKLYLSGCSQLVSLPASFGRLKSLRYLDMNLPNLTGLPEGFGNLFALEELCFLNCSKLFVLPASFGNLTALNELTFDSCHSITTFPESFGNLHALKKLHVLHCSGLVGLPHQFGQLKSLVHLAMKDCKGLKTLSSDFRCLPSLGALRAYGCSLLEGNAMDMLVEIESLMLVDIRESPMLIERWEQLREQHPLIVE
ncbi:hypothetical protein KI387_033431, partial [Taxus chinensis]